VLDGRVFAAGVTVDYYDLLKVPRSANPAEITRAYKAAVGRYHPDRHEQNDLQELAEERLKQLNEAYSVLSDPQRRAMYDAGARGPSLGQRVGPMPPVSPHALRRSLLMWGGLLLLLPVIVRTIGNPRLFSAILLAFVGWRIYRRFRRR
jgi:curved DNA-binding protein CbpA